MAPKKPSWSTDPLEGALGAGPASALRTAGRYIGGGLQGFLGSQAVRESPFGAASALLAPRQAYAIGTERMGPYVPERLQHAPTAPVLPSPITSPNTTFQHADDEYNRLKSQFGGPAGVEQLATQASLPVGFTPTGAKGPASLKDFYSAQRQVGGRDIESIIGQMDYKGNMADWARHHQDLAQREYAKKFSADQAAAAYGGTGPSDETIRSAISGGKYFPSEGSPSPVTNPPNFGTPANAVPAPPTQQGAAVSAPYAEAQRQAAEKTAGATGMPQFPTLGGDWLSKVMASPWGQALKNTGGAMGIDYIQGIR